MNTAEVTDNAEAAPERRSLTLAHGALWLALFACGAFAFMFKGRGGSGSEFLPFSPLQILIPALGTLGIFAMFMSFGSRFPMFFVRSPASKLLLTGIGCICLGAAMHIDGGEYDLESVLFIARWLMPVGFIAFYCFAQMHGLSWRPIALGFAAGAFCSAVAVELYRRGVSLPIDQKTEGRFGGFFSHPNQYGIVTATSATMIAVLLHSPRVFFKLLGTAMIGIYGLCLFQSLSKTNIVLFALNIAASLIVLSLGSPAKLVRALGYSAVLAVLLGFGAVAGFNVMSTMMPREAKLIEDAIFDPRGVKSLDVREDVWADAWQYAAVNPLMGLGPGRAGEMLIKKHAHNLFLQAHLDTGLLGLAGICLIVLAILWRAAQLTREAMRAGAGIGDDEAVRLTSGVAMVIYVIGNLMSDSFGTATIPVFVIFAAFAFVNQDWKQKHEDE